MNWIPMAIAIIVFVTSCVGLGYLTGFLERRRKWPGWVSGLLAFTIACLGPAITVGFVLYTGSRYAAQHPGEVNDAPAMVLMGVIQVSPFIFFFGLSFAVIGLCIARRGDSAGSSDDWQPQPNNSMRRYAHASGSPRQSSVRAADARR